MADFNRDGKLDVATDEFLLLGNGEGQFENPEKLSNEFSAAATGDFNADGKPDLIGAGVGFDEVTALLGKGNGSFRAALIYAVGDGNLSVAVGDFNNDGRPDLVVAESLSNDLNVLINQGRGHFAAARDFSGGSGLFSIAVGDFDRDGKVDIAFGDIYDEMTVVFGKGNGTFGAAKQLPGQNSGFLVTADFDGDGASDIASFNLPSNSGPPDDIWVTLSDGKRGFHASRSFFAGPGVTNMAVGDFNADGKPDMAVSAGKFICVLIGNGDGTFQSPVSTFLGDAVGALAAADLDGDGKADIAASVGGKVYILLGKGDGTFAKPLGLGSSFLDAMSIVVADFNGDRIPDLAIADSSATSVDVFLGKGDGKFLTPTKYPLSSEPVSLLAADFNLDGKIDIVVSAKGANAFVLFGNGNGKFQRVTQIGSGQGGGAIASADVNHDGKPDLMAIPGSFAESFTVFLNVTKKAP